MMFSILQMMAFSKANTAPVGSREDSAEKARASGADGKPQALGKAAPTPVTAKAKTPTTASSAKARPAKSAATSAPTPTAKATTKPLAPSVYPPTAVKAASKAVPKTATKPAATPAPKSPLHPVGKATVAVAAKKTATKTAKSAAKAATLPQAAPAVSAAVVSAPSKPVVPRAARGSRLAQLTVPSMAQAVASTAAKASYTQTMSTTPVVTLSHVVPKKDPKLANNWKTKPLVELVDAEVLAMSDDDYMNEVQMAYFKHKLVRLKTEILNSAGETTEHLREDTVVVPDPADRATIEEEHALELRTRDRERKLLKKIEQSINRIDAGDYGYCDETGEPIGVGRLLARPTASLSLEAQQRRELKQKMFGD